MDTYRKFCIEVQHCKTTEGQKDEVSSLRFESFEVKWTRVKSSWNCVKDMKLEARTQDGQGGGGRWVMVYTGIAFVCLFRWFFFLAFFYLLLLFLSLPSPHLSFTAEMRKWRQIRLAQPDVITVTWPVSRQRTEVVHCRVYFSVGHVVRLTNKQNTSSTDARTRSCASDICLLSCWW